MSLFFIQEYKEKQDWAQRSTPHLNNRSFLYTFLFTSLFLAAALTGECVGVWCFYPSNLGGNFRRQRKLAGFPQALYTNLVYGVSVWQGVGLILHSLERLSCFFQYTPAPHPPYQTLRLWTNFHIYFLENLPHNYLAKCGNFKLLQ